MPAAAATASHPPLAQSRPLSDKSAFPAGASPLSRLVKILLVLALAAGAAGLAAGWQWRSEKLVRLHPAPGPLPARPDPGNAVGGVLLFGDSRVAQWRPLPDRPYPVTRHGHSGESAIRLAFSFEAALDRHRPELAIVQAGVNDAVAASLAGPRDRERALADSKAAFARMAAAAQARGVALVLLKPIPPIRPDPARRLLWRGHVGPYLESLSAALPAIAAAHGATVTDPLPLLGPDAASVPSAYRADALHLTPAAYERLGVLLPETLSPETPPPRS
jgi:lysophospholipase L1-like esterase